MFETGSRSSRVGAAFTLRQAVEEGPGMHYCQHCEPAVTLEPAADVAVCSRCGWTEPARREPLYVVTGASGSGKSAIFAPLAAALPECVVFDVDWLIDPMKTAGSVDWDAFRDAWLSVAHGIAQGRRSTVLLGPLMPEQLVDLPSRRWIGPIRFAVLDCTDEQRRARLQARPSWREHAIDEHLAFAAHLRRTIPTVLHTGTDTPAQTAQQIAAWVKTPHLAGGLAHRDLLHAAELLSTEAPGSAL